MRAAWSGKNHWIEEHLASWPALTLDEIRRELKIDPADSQGAVIAKAEDRAREYLRKGESFVFNATNLSRQLRSQWIGLFESYHARIRIVYVEVPFAKLYEQNRQRKAQVPAKVIERLLERWEVPDRTEAHQVEWVVQD